MKSHHIFNSGNMHSDPARVVRTGGLKTTAFIPAIIIAVLMIIFGANNGNAETITLHDCLMEAMSNNPSLKEGDLGIKAGEEEITGASGRRLPKVSLDSNYTNRQEPYPFIPAKSNAIPPHFSDEYASWQAVMTIPIYQGGQIDNAVKLAEIRQAVRTDTLTLTRNEILANTVNSYNKLLQLFKLKEAATSSVDALEAQRKNVSMLYDLGRVARVDLLKVEVQLANEKQRLATINEGISASRETLSFLMGRSVSGKESDVAPADKLTFAYISADFDQGLTDAHKNRPEYLIANGGIEEADVNARNSVGKLLPSVSATGGYLNQYGFQPRYNESTWYMGINISIPIFDRSSHADVSRDRILKQKAQTRLTSVDNQIRLDVRNAITSLNESRSRIESASTAVLQAEESYRIENQKYSTGAGTMVDMLLADAANFTAAANYSQALFDYNSAMVAYRRATGTLEDFLK
jgi:outer membrane protein